MLIITSAAGVPYRRQTFTDAWGRQRVCDKRLADLPRPHMEACAACGQPLTTQRSTRRFCSGRCRVRAWRQRQERG